MLIYIDGKAIEIPPEGCLVLRGELRFFDDAGNPGLFFRGEANLASIRSAPAGDAAKKADGSFRASVDLAKQNNELKELEDRSKRLQLKIPHKLDFVWSMTRRAGVHSLFSATMGLFGWNEQQTWEQISLSEFPWFHAKGEGKLMKDRAKQMPASEWKALREAWIKGKNERDKFRKRLEIAYNGAYTELQKPDVQEEYGFRVEHVQPDDALAAKLPNGRLLVGSREWVVVSNLGVVSNG